MLECSAEPGNKANAAVHSQQLLKEVSTFTHMNTIISKKNPPSKISPLPFLNEVVAKGAFLSKVHPLIYAAVHAVMLSKKY